MDYENKFLTARRKFYRLVDECRHCSALFCSDSELVSYVEDLHERLLSPDGVYRASEVQFLIACLEKGFNHVCKVEKGSC